MSTILNYEKWKMLKEQENLRGVSVKTKMATSSESEKVQVLFMSGFLPTLTPGRENLTVSQYIDKLKSITDQQLMPVIDFFKNKGYSQPNSDIKKFQQDLKNVTGISTFTNTEQMNNEFNDGVFGVATAKTMIQKVITDLSKQDSNRNVGEMFASAVKTIADPTLKHGTKQAEPASVAGKDVEIGVGTQKLKK